MEPDPASAQLIMVRDRAHAGGVRSGVSAPVGLPVTGHLLRTSEKDGAEIPPNMDSVDCDGGAFHRVASVLDGGSRRILGFGLSEHHDAEMAHGAGPGHHGARRAGARCLIYPTRAASTPRAPSGQPARG